MTFNPLLIRHLRTAVRRSTIYWLLALYLILTAIFFMLVLSMTQIPNISFSRASLYTFYTSGQAIFWVSAAALLGTAWLLAPLPALGMIAGEVSHRTLDLLKLTTLPRRAIVLGKIEAALLEGGLFILAPLPIFFYGFWIGGISTVELALTLLFLITTFVGSTAFALFLSAHSGKTITAILVYYGLVFASWIVAGTTASAVGMFTYTTAMTDNTYPFIIQALIAAMPVFLSALYPPAAAIATETYGIQQGRWLLVAVDVTTATGLRTFYLPSPWILYTFLIMLLTILTLFQTIRKLKKKER